MSAAPARISAMPDTPQPFRSAEDAWLWAMAALKAEREHLPFDGGVKRPCEPNDVVQCLNSLYRRRRISREHARILRIWGERGEAPPEHRRRRCYSAEHHLWTQAMAVLERPLRARGIVAGENIKEWELYR